MYEFSNKETRKKFKATEYGKKTNKWLLLSVFVAVISFVVCVSICILVKGENVKLTSTSEILLISLKAITFICIIGVCYFDGKRDGAIEQFKRTLKNKK